jgi:hypothetical protein
MDQRIESFLGEVLALVGEEPDAVRDGVRVALAKCEAIFRLQEPKKRMRDQAAHACRALCRTRVVAEMYQRRGTPIAEHLRLVLSIIDSAGALKTKGRRRPSRLTHAACNNAASGNSAIEWGRDIDG